MKIPLEGIDAVIEGGSLILTFEKQYMVLSSGLTNAGFVETKTIINHHVDSKSCNSDCDKCEHQKSVEEHTNEIVEKFSLPEDAIVLMTAAKMKNMSITSESFTDTRVVGLITAGISNAVRAGDPATIYEDNGRFHRTGTINIILLTNAQLSERAMVGSIITATEAKTAILYALGVKSKYSEGQATGTGTDSIVVVSNPEGHRIDYAGTHGKFGEMVSKVVLTGVRQALWKQEGIPEGKDDP